MTHHAAYSIALVISLGLLAQWVAWRVRLPAIVLLSVFGVLVSAQALIVAMFGGFSSLVFLFIVGTSLAYSLRKYRDGAQIKAVMAMLEKLSNVAAASHAPFIAAASPKLFDMGSFTEMSNPRDLAKIFESTELIKWRSFRESEDSRYVALTLPHILLRLPYGPNTIPVVAAPLPPMAVPRLNLLRPTMPSTTAISPNRNPSAPTRGISATKNAASPTVTVYQSRIPGSWPVRKFVQNGRKKWHSPHPICLISQ